MVYYISSDFHILWIYISCRVKPRTNIDMCCFSTSQHKWHILKTGGLGIRIIYNVEWCVTREVFHQWASTINKSNNKITELRTILQSKIKVSKSTYSSSHPMWLRHIQFTFWSTSTNIVLRCFIAVRYSLLLSNILLSDPSLFILFFTAAVVSIWIRIVLTLSSAWK
jgi:hypothetical protein